MFVEVERFFDIKHRLYPISPAAVAAFEARDHCPACGASSDEMEAAVELGRPEWTSRVVVGVCRECAHICYTNPPSDEFLRGYYAEEFAVSSSPDTKSVPSQSKVSDALRDLGVPPTSRVLDVGCGYGSLLGGLADAGFSDLWGCEQSADRLAVSRARFGDRIFEAGWEGIPDEERFDVVYSNHVFEHLRDPDRAFEHVSGQLNGGGVIVLAVPDAREESVINQTLYLPHIHSFTPDGLTSLGARFDFEASFWTGAGNGELVARFRRGGDDRDTDGRWMSGTDLLPTDPATLSERLRQPWTRRRATLTWPGAGVDPAHTETFVLSRTATRFLPMLGRFERMIRDPRLQLLYFFLTRARRLLSRQGRLITTSSYLRLSAEVR